jgi:hypothetical protein
MINRASLTTEYYRGGPRPSWRGVLKESVAERQVADAKVERPRIIRTARIRRVEAVNEKPRPMGIKGGASQKPLSMDALAKILSPDSQGTIPPFEI